MNVTTSNALRLCTIAMVCAAHSVSAEPFFQGIGHLPESSSYTAAFNISGDGSIAVGVAHGPPEGHQPIRWDAENGLQRLEGPTNPGWQSHATAASFDGSVIVGSNAMGAFRWTEAGGSVSLSDTWDTATDVSHDGSIITGYWSTPYTSEAYRWVQGVGMVGLGSLPETTASFGQAISASGDVIVGASGYLSGAAEAFRWSEASGMVGIGHLPGGTYPGTPYANSRALDVSDDGSVIVGYSYSEHGKQAFRWTEESGMVALGDLPGGQFESSAYAVSGDGSIVVGAGVPDSTHRAFIWDESNGMRLLSAVLTVDFGLDLEGWLLGSAWGISTDGTTIAGFGHNPQGEPEGWVARIPEPCSSALLIAGMVTLLTGRRTPRGQRPS